MTVEKSVFGTTLRRAGLVLRLVRFSHTLFALPYVIAGFALGAESARAAGEPGPGTPTFLLTIGAAVCARTAAMAFNRLVDRRLDARNPRTKARPSATGEASPALMTGVTVAASAGFVAASFALNPLCGRLSFVALLVVLGYSYAKRFTATAHFVLGVGLGLAPVGAYLAVRGAFDAASLGVVAMGAAVLVWTAGFDVLYACQDAEFDRAEGLHALPAKLGVGGALRVARACHATVPLFLLAAAALSGLGPWFVGGVVIAACLLAYEHRLVRADDLSQVDRAFFHVNAAIAFVVMASTLIDLKMRP